MFMKSARSVTLRQTASEVFGRTAAIRRKTGVAGLVGRACHRLASPVEFLDYDVRGLAHGFESRGRT